LIVDVPALSPLHTDKKPWDHTHGYATVLGNMQVKSVVMADFAGPSACGNTAAGGGVFALANHPNAPDAFHPHFLQQVSMALDIGIRQEALTLCSW
jgi:hypothetical protein